MGGQVCGRRGERPRGGGLSGGVRRGVGRVESRAVGVQCVARGTAAAWGLGGRLSATMETQRPTVDQRVARESTYNSLLTVDHAGSEGVWCLVEVPKRQIVLRRRAAK